MVSMGDSPTQGIVRRRMGDNALQNKPPCRMTGSKKGLRFNVTPPYVRSNTQTTQSLGIVRCTVDLMPKTPWFACWWCVFVISDRAISPILLRHGMGISIDIALLERASIALNTIIGGYINSHPTLLSCQRHNPL
jgi:hypothetical protein